VAGWIPTVTSTLAAMGVLAAGCGGGGATYSLDATLACLENRGLPVSTDEADLYDVARDAEKGALWARLPQNSVTIAFAGSDDEAKRTERAFKARAAAFPTASSVDELVQRRGTVVLLWEKLPNVVASASVDECLES
jgi:hypothetical protein